MKMKEIVNCCYGRVNLRQQRQVGWRESGHEPLYFHGFD
jgi:ribosome modulation factor